MASSQMILVEQKPKNNVRITAHIDEKDSNKSSTVSQVTNIDNI